MTAYSDILLESNLSESKFGPMKSSHEALGVLLEEFQELTEAIRKNDRAAVRKEAIQVSSVAMRLAEACDRDVEFQERSGFISGR